MLQNKNKFDFTIWGGGYHSFYLGINFEFIWGYLFYLVVNSIQNIRFNPRVKKFVSDFPLPIDNKNHI